MAHFKSISSFELGGPTGSKLLSQPPPPHPLTALPDLQPFLLRWGGTSCSLRRPALLACRVRHRRGRLEPSVPLIWRRRLGSQAHCWPPVKVFLLGRGKWLLLVHRLFKTFVGTAIFSGLNICFYCLGNNISL